MNKEKEEVEESIEILIWDAGASLCGWSGALTIIKSRQNQTIRSQKPFDCITHNVCVCVCIFANGFHFLRSQKFYIFFSSISFDQKMEKFVELWKEAEKHEIPRNEILKNEWSIALQMFEDVQL